MKILHVIAAASVLGLPLAAVSTPVMAATAHNSQAGGTAEGNTKNAATPAGMMKRKRQMERRQRGM